MLASEQHQCFIYTSMDSNWIVDLTRPYPCSPHTPQMDRQGVEWGNTNKNRKKMNLVLVLEVAHRDWTRRQILKPKRFRKSNIGLRIVKERPDIISVSIRPFHPALTSTDAGIVLPGNKAYMQHQDPDHNTANQHSAQVLVDSRGRGCATIAQKK